MGFLHGLAITIVVCTIIYTIFKEPIDNMIENLREMMRNG